MLDTKVETFTVPAALPQLGTAHRGRRGAIACAVGIALPVMLLSTFAATKTATLLMGKRICISAFQYDPCDMLRGNYIKLSFKTPSAEKFSVGQQVFVTYKQAGKSELWTLGAASAERPALKSGEVCIKGTVRKQDAGAASIEYPFSQFYTSEASARIPSQNSLEAQLAVDPSGDAVITQLKAGGKIIGSI